MEIGEGLENIIKMYDQSTYFDQYGGSLLMFIIITIILFVLVSYCFAKINAQPIIDDWTNQRCKPNIIPFAGFITHPHNTSAFDYTYENFTYCTQSIMSSITGLMVEPITFVIKIINDVLDAVKKAINDIRAMFNKIRIFFQTMAEELMGRIMNMMIPLQKIIISFRDFIGKLQGSMTTGLFTLLGGYYALKSLMGAIAQFIITILITLAAIIIVLWIIPFTWGMAASMTAIFIAIAIPMAIILVFMLDVLKVQPDLSIPTLECFDEDTLLPLNDGTHKKISQIEIGDILINNNDVTSIIKVNSNCSTMYNLNNIIVSHSHLVNYKEKWISIKDHPDAIICQNYNKPYLYCLNTRQKIIKIDNFIFTDWNEINNNFVEIKNNLNDCLGFNDIKNIKNIEDINKYLDSGFNENTKIILINGTCKTIKEIEIGNILDCGSIVRGIVIINGNKLTNHYKYIFNNTIIEGGPNLPICDNKIINYTTLNLDKTNKEIKNEKATKLYHLLTDTKTFYVEKIKFYDYNASVDIFLDKYKGKLLSMKYV
uniref:Vint domain-containing protein n=1 Tax=viral metagenome TaxID=1070528 RepID=A0A6C0IEP5_9ZZZZ